MLFINCLQVENVGYCQANYVGLLFACLFVGGGCGVGLGLGWGFGTAFGSQYRSSTVTFQGIEFSGKDQGADKEFKDLTK